MPDNRTNKTNSTKKTGARDSSSSSSSSYPGFIPPHGGYENLLAYRKSQIIYDDAVRFCDRFIDRRSRTHDQMVQAARSGNKMSHRRKNRKRCSPIQPSPSSRRRRRAAMIPARAAVGRNTRSAAENEPARIPS